MGIDKRFAQLPDLLKKKSFSQIAKEIEVTPQALTRVVNGQNKPGYDIIARLVGRYSMNPYWILLGEGEPIIKGGLPELEGEGPSVNSEFYDLRRLIAKVEELEREVEKLKEKKE